MDKGSPTRLVGPDGRRLSPIRQPIASERATIDTLYAHYSDGASCRRTGAVNPHKGNTVPHVLHSWGWVMEDLRQRLMAVDPIYRASQEAWQPDAVVEPKAE